MVEKGQFLLIYSGVESCSGILRSVIPAFAHVVDCTQSDYPRLVNLDQPKLTTHAAISDRHRFSQHRMDILNLETNRLENFPVEGMAPLISCAPGSGGGGYSIYCLYGKGRDDPLRSGVFKRCT